MIYTERREGVGETLTIERQRFKEKGCRQTQKEQDGERETYIYILINETGTHIFFLQFH